MTLVEFLLARIAEDEADACPCCDHGPGTISYHLRREAVAKRAIVEHCDAVAVCEVHGRTVANGCEECSVAKNVAVNDAWVLRHLANIYADHPDYDPEWRP